MAIYTVREARAQLSELIERALDGQIEIVRDGSKAVQSIPVPAPESRRAFGALRGKIEVGSDFFDPLPPEELSAWEG